MVIAVSNQKGGVGKTSVCVSLGAGLTRLGKRVLLVDVDGQGSLTLSLGCPRPDELDVTLATALEAILLDESTPYNILIRQHEEGMDYIPGNIFLSGLELTLINVMSRETVLRRLIEQLRPQYDYILLDCSPNLGQLTINALTAADRVIIPVQAQYLSLKGLEQLLKTIWSVRRQINPKLSIGGILLTMINSRTAYAREITDLLTVSYGDRINIFTTRIPASVRAAECSAFGVSIFKHDKNGKVAEAYAALTNEVLSWEL